MLIVAPYFGEFGWQLMRWQGIARAMSKGQDRTIVRCVGGYEYLYEDFASEIITHRMPPRAQISMWHCIVEGVKYEVDVNIAENTDKVLSPTKGVGLGDHTQKFIKYGRREFQCDEILVHARSTDNSGTGYRNWSLDNWQTIISKISDFKVISIGTVSAAEHVPGTEDFRGAPLKELANRMAEARLLLSPSSGPAHFAALCGLPHVVWSRERIEVLGMTNRQRYESAWNPFSTPCRFISTWQPAPDTVWEEVQRALSSGNDNVRAG